MIRDYTFCSKLDCENIRCKRNQNSPDFRKAQMITADRDEYIWVGNFENCEYFKKVEKDDE